MTPSILTEVQLPSDATRFLAELSGRLTFQTFDDRKTDEGRHLARVLHSTEQLVELNGRGAGIFVMINEGDGHGRELKNVQRVRAFTSDFDNPDAPPPAHLPLEESIRVETSRGKYQLWWLLEDGIALTNEEFNAQQEAIAAAVGSELKDCKGLNRVHRIPGFTHWKGVPFISRLLKVTGHRYSLEDIRQAFPVVTQAPETRPEMRLTLPTIDRPKTAQETRRKYALTALGRAAGELAAMSENSGRNIKLNEVAYVAFRRVAGGHLTEAEVIESLTTAASSAGLSRTEVATTLQSARKGLTEPDSLDHVGNDTGKQRSRRERKADLPSAASVSAEGNFVMPAMPHGVVEGTDAANAFILAANKLQNRMRYTTSLNWVLYQENGTWRTNADPTLCAAVAGQILRGTVANHLARLISDRASEQDIERTFKWSKSVCNFQTVSNALKVAAGFPEFYTPIEAWDARPDLLNCLNGVLELATGKLLPHSPNYLMTWQAGAAFKPGMTHPHVERLKGLLLEDGRHDFLQRSTGSTLFGENPNETLTVLQGVGGAGKGTLSSAVMRMLGDYAGSIEVNLLLANSHGETSTGAKPELLALRGKRLIVAGEPPKGARFNAGRVKGMTGNDPITARGMRSDVMVTFHPVFKLWIHTNYAIGAAHDDSGLQRRMHVIPFKAKPAKPDPTFKKVLESDPDALSALLNWAFEGYQIWRKNGFDLGMSSEIEEATGEYWKDQNPYEKFASERLVFGRYEEIPSGRLKVIFEEWCEENGHRVGKAVKIADLHTYLRQQQCDAQKGAKGSRKWVGVAEVAGVASEPPINEDSYNALNPIEGQDATCATRATRDDVQVPATWEEIL